MKTLLLGLCLALAGCLSTTTVIRRTADGVTIKSPKDGTRQERGGDDYDGACSIKSIGYSGIANVQALEAQGKLMTGIARGVAEGIVKAAGLAVAAPVQ